MANYTPAVDDGKKRKRKDKDAPKGIEHNAIAVYVYFSSS